MPFDETANKSIAPISQLDIEADEAKAIQDGVKRVHSMLFQDTVYESPINLYIGNVTPLQLAPLKWHHMDLRPKKAKISNTGHTVILSAKWLQERPFLSGGPFVGNYVFSQLHFHWGATNLEGSEHTVNGARSVLEMHAVFFKSCYLTQESALKRKDGVAVAAYLFNLQDETNESIQMLMDSFESIKKADTSIRVNSYPLEKFLTAFTDDYFLYLGSVNTATCIHYVMWLICRVPLGISIKQMETFRTLTDQNSQLLRANFREIQPLNGRKVYHVNSSGQMHSTLLVMDRITPGSAKTAKKEFSKYPRSSIEYQNPTGTTIYTMETPKNPYNFFKSLYANQERWFNKNKNKKENAVDEEHKM